MHWKWNTSLEPHHQQYHAQIPCAKEKLMETTNTTTTADTTHTTSSNAPTDSPTVKHAGHWASNSAKDATNVCTPEATIASPLNHGHQQPLLNAQTNAPTVDPTSAETLLTQPTHTNTSLASTEPLLDASLVQED